MCGEGQPANTEISVLADSDPQQTELQAASTAHPPDALCVYQQHWSSLLSCGQPVPSHRDQVAAVKLWSLSISQHQLRRSSRVLQQGNPSTDRCFVCSQPTNQASSAPAAQPTLADTSTSTTQDARLSRSSPRQHLAGRRRGAPMHVDIFPPPPNLLPHARLLCGYRQGPARAAVYLLLQSHVAHNGCIRPQHANLQR